jgi:SAM-dependent methyltransferase
MRRRLLTSSRLDEQHYITTKTLGFLIHPSIQLPKTSKPLRVAEIGTGTGIWLLDVAKTLPSGTQLTGFDITDSAFPAKPWPDNIDFRLQDMFLPFPPADLGIYDLVAIRFISSATTRADWIRALKNLMTLLKPGGWLQWIESCNFALYSDIPGTSRAACTEIWDGMAPFRDKDDLVIGLMARFAADPKREEVWRGVGLTDVHEDVFSTDRLQDASLKFREKGTRNIIECFVECLEAMVGKEGSGWTNERVVKLKERAAREILAGVYHTLDQVCLVGRKAL